tara:strand:+ start:3370 stop:3948 length:579 start_codon:yes stop_codon:yes gene_type:complete
MENIDLTKYNCNYELQFVQFMVDVLKPYIDFQSFDTEEKRINLAGESVPKKGLRIFLKKENGIQESIDENGFIQFIQVDFSTIRSELKEKYTDELTKEQEKKRHFDTITRGNMGPYGGRSKPHDMSKTEFDEKMEYYGSQSSEYEKRIRAINYNIRKLEEIGKICYGRTKTIQDVLHFLNNVKDHYNFNAIT